MTVDPQGLRRPRVVLVEGCMRFAESLRIALATEGLVAEVVSAPSREGLLRGLLDRRPDLVLFDLDLADELGQGDSLVSPLAAAGLRVLLVSGTAGPARIAWALQAGAIGYVTAAQPVRQLLAAVTEVACRPVSADPPPPPAPVAGPVDPDRELEPYERLSPRERQVLVGLANGLSIDAMARTWSEPESTVRQQIRALLVKLGVASQPAAVAAARRAGWLAAAPEA